MFLLAQDIGIPVVILSHWTTIGPPLDHRWTAGGPLGSAISAASQSGLAHLWGEAMRLLRGTGGAVKIMRILGISHGISHAISCGVECVVECTIQAKRHSFETGHDQSAEWAYPRFGQIHTERKGCFVPNLHHWI